MRTASLRAVAVTAFAGPSRPFRRLKKAPSELLLRCNVLAAIRKVWAARLALGLVLELNLLPPEILFSGLNPSQEVKWRALGQQVISIPSSPISFNAVLLSIPGIFVRSTPVRLSR